MTRMNVIWVVVVIAALAAISFFAVRTKHTSPTNDSVTVALPPVTLGDYTGVGVPLAEFRGTPIVVSFWASWCAPCTKELAAAALLQKEFGDRVIFVAVNRGESAEVARHVYDPSSVGTSSAALLDPSDSFFKSMGGFAMPEILFVDAGGTIQFHARGPIGTEELRRRTKNLLSL